jgi:hypothetical protein
MKFLTLCAIVIVIALILPNSRHAIIGAFTDSADAAGQHTRAAVNGSLGFR